MTRDDIIRIAGECGFTALDRWEHVGGGGSVDVDGEEITPELMRFAAAIIERCAGVAEQRGRVIDDSVHIAYYYGAKDCAVAIRAEYEELK